MTEESMEIGRDLTNTEDAVPVSIQDEISALKQIIIGQEQAIKSQSAMISDLTKQIGAIAGQVRSAPAPEAKPEASAQDRAFAAALAKYGVDIKKVKE